MPLQTLTELLSLIEQLPIEDRAEAIARLDHIVSLDDHPRQLALGLLALDLAPKALDMAPQTLIRTPLPQPA